MFTKETERETRKEQISQGRKLQWEQVIWIKPKHVWTKRVPKDRGNSKDKIGFYTAGTSARLILDYFKVGNVVKCQGKTFDEQILFSTDFDAWRLFPSSEPIFLK